MMQKVVALVTGAGGTLGGAAARQIVSRGGKVALLDLPKSSGAELAKELGQNAMFFPADVTSESEVQEAVNQTVGTFGCLNTVINCAGVTRARCIFNFSKNAPFNISEAQEMVDVNIIGTINVIRLTAGDLARNEPDEEGLRGLIINTSGFGAFDGQTSQVPLCGCWGAIASMTLPLCREFAAAGIRVMAVAPGVFSSNLTSHLPVKVVNTFATITPAPKRLGASSDFAHLVQCIIENRFLNGEVIRLDGGLRVQL